MAATENPPAVPVLYLDSGFLADRADSALRITQIIRESEDSDRPTPGASTTLSLWNQAVTLPVPAASGLLPLEVCVPVQQPDRRVECSRTQMHVLLRCGEVLMARQLLNRLGWRASHREVRAEMGWHP